MIFNLKYFISFELEPPRGQGVLEIIRLIKISIKRVIKATAISEELLTTIPKCLQTHEIRVMCLI